MSLFDPTRPDIALIGGTVERSEPLMVSLNRRGGGTIGPCRYEPRRIVVTTVDGHTHSADAGPPPAGTPCLVGFADNDESQPWVLAFVDWPQGASS